MNRTDKIFFYLLLVVPFASSILSTIHIIDFVHLGNITAMALAVAITFEVSSVISFAATGGSVLKHVNKGWLYFIFVMLFVLQVLGNVYSGFSYMNHMLVSDPKWLNNVMEMTFGYFTISEVKLVLATCIGLPLPVISLVMLKFAIDKASISAFYGDTSGDIPESTQDADVDNIDVETGSIPVVVPDVTTNTTGIMQSGVDSEIEPDDISSPVVSDAVLVVAGDTNDDAKQVDVAVSPVVDAKPTNRVKNVGGIIKGFNLNGR